MLQVLLWAEPGQRFSPVPHGKAFVRVSFLSILIVLEVTTGPRLTIFGHSVFIREHTNVTVWSVLVRGYPWKFLKVQGQQLDLLYFLFCDLSREERQEVPETRALAPPAWY